MGRKYTRTIDEYGVDAHQLRVSGRVDIDDEEGSRLLFDEQVLIVMLGRATAPTFTETTDGDVLRVNVIKPIEAHVVVDGKARTKIMGDLGFINEAQMTLPYTGPSDDDGGDEEGSPEGPVTLLEEEDEDWSWVLSGPVAEESSGDDEPAPADGFWVDGEPEPEPTDEDAWRAIG